MNQIFANAPPDPHDSVADPSLKKAWRVANGLEDAEEEQVEIRPVEQVSEELLVKRMSVVGEDCPM